MKSWILVVLVFSLVQAKNPDLDEDWADFQQRYDKTYEVEGEAEVTVHCFLTTHAKTQMHF